MEWEDDAYVLSARAHGESGAIVDLLTAEHGRFAAHVAGGASKKMRAMLQPGSRVIARYRARVSEQLGSASLEQGYTAVKSFSLHSNSEGPRREFKITWGLIQTLPAVM